MALRSAACVSEWERCPTPAPGENPAACARTTLEDFVLAPGKTHEIRGLPDGYRECVSQQGVNDCT